MKVTVTKKPIARLKLKLKGFEKDFKASFDLEKAFVNNTDVSENMLKDDKQLRKLVFLSADWSNIFMLYDLTDKVQLGFDVYKCEIENLITYKPGVLDAEKGVFNLEEVRGNKTEFMIVTSHNERVDKHIEYMIAQNLIDFVNFEWKMVFNLDKNGGR